MLPINKLHIGMACDHAGFELKEYIKRFLEMKGALVCDFGTDSTQSVDYPDFAHPLAQAVEEKKCDCGITICGSGNGICMTANKHQGIRAALCWDTPLATLARQHNNANVISLPARFISKEKAIEMVEIFLTTPFEGGRHISRIEKIPLKKNTDKQIFSTYFD